MVGLTVLWLPILLSSVIVFVASSLIHMLTPWHKNDYRRVPRENEVLDALRSFAIPPGDYMAPQASSTREMRSPEFVEKIKKGPVIVLTVIPPGPMGMTKSLILWFLYIAGVALFAAYVAGRALSSGAEYLSVFRFTGTVAFVGYSVALLQMSIWYRRSWCTTVKATIDGLFYALLMAGTFGWLWPN